jgi:hypothetical protein
MSAFGPYIAGVMTGQIAVLLGGVFVALTGWPLIIEGRLPQMPIIALWVAICVVAVISDAWRPVDRAFYGSQSALHAIWWLMMPILVMLLSWHWARLVPPERLLRIITRVIMIAMTVNSVLAVIQLSTATVDLGGVLRGFWSAAPGGATTVAQLAAENGRYTGVFDQPAEAGMAYGIALICIIYLLKRGERWQLAYACAGLVVVGGVLSISKVFLFVALPIAVWSVANSPGLRLRILAGVSLGVLAVVGAGVAGLLPAWGIGNTAFESFLHPSGSFASLYTANRYGRGGGTLGPVASEVLHTAPWAGFGLAGLNTPYDSLWLEIFVISGIIGIIFLCAILAVLAVAWRRASTSVAPAEKMLSGSILLLAVASSLGFPSLTANRAGILTWLILGVLLGADQTHPGGQASSPQPG